ncbi:MAG: amidohydrolase [Bdellovibrionota bacterium]
MSSLKYQSLDCDLLVTGGTMVLMDDQRRVLEDAALAIKDSWILWIGHPSEISDIRAKTVLDAKGKWILPGMINGHCHSAMSLLRGLADDRKLMDWLTNVIWPAESKYADEQFVSTGTSLSCLEMMASGITCFADMYFHAGAVAKAASDAGMRAICGQNVIDFDTPDNPKGWDFGLDLVRAHASQWSGHSLIRPGIAPHSPYAVAPNHLQQAHQLSMELDLPFLIHVAEPETEAQQIRDNFGASVPSVIEYLESLGVLTSNMIAAHVIWTDPDHDLPRLKKNRVGVVHCPHSNMKLASGVAHIPSMISHGIAVGLGTDGAASNNDLSLWEEMDLAAKLHKLIQKDPTVMPAKTVFEMATIEGARAIGQEKMLGSLEVGKKADLIVVDRDTPHQIPTYDPYAQLVYASKSSDVCSVVVDGVLIYHQRKPTLLDKQKVFADVEQYRKKLS